LTGEGFCCAGGASGKKSPKKRTLAGVASLFFRSDCRSLQSAVVVAWKPHRSRIMRQTSLEISSDWAGRAAWLRRQVDWLLPYAALAVIAAIAFGMPSPHSF
jgi:hypothetical protein